MEERMNHLRTYMLDPIMKKLDNIEKRLNNLEQKIISKGTKIISKGTKNVKEITKNLEKPHPKPKITTIKNAFFINENTKLNDVKLRWDPIDNVSRYIIEEKCLNHGEKNEKWYRNRFTQDYLRYNFVYLPKFGIKFHQDWSTIGSKKKMTGMMGKFRWRYIPIYYENGTEIEGIKSEPSDIWESPVINIEIGIEII